MTSSTDRQDQAVSDYAAGNLSPARHDLMACAVELNPHLAKSVAAKTAAAASLMMEIRPVPLSPFLIGNALEKLPYGTSAAEKSGTNDLKSSSTPKVLRDLMDGAGLRDIKWKSLIPGIAIYDVLGSRKSRTRDRMYLLRAKGGMQFPEHSHHGEEWTLILSGSYKTERNRYGPGDLHISDETTDHAPYVEAGEDCICLVVTRGQLQMKGWLPKLLQKVVGI